MYDLVQVMAQNNPQVEKLTIWGFTEEEVLHRWKVSEHFQPVNRLFGGTKPSEGSAEVPPKTINDSPHAERFLEHLLSEGGDDG